MPSTRAYVPELFAALPKGCSLLRSAVEHDRRTAQASADFSAAIAHECAISASLDGRTVFDHDSRLPRKTKANLSPRLSLFSDFV
jgi:hypothetical protein